MTTIKAPSFQYVHIRSDDYYPIDATIALLDITKSDLEHLFTTHSNQLMLVAGLSIKSEKDRFIKKIGREEAHKRLNMVVFDLLEVLQKGTTHEYVLEASEVKHNRSTYKMRIKLSTVAESSKVRFIFGKLYE